LGRLFYDGLVAYQAAGGKHSNFNIYSDDFLHSPGKCYVPLIFEDAILGTEGEDNEDALIGYAEVPEEVLQRGVAILSVVNLLMW
jgi:hypothetical protein